MSYQKYVDDFNQFAIEAIEKHKPTVDQSLKIGTISQMSSYLKSFKDCMKNLEELLINKANTHLVEAKDDSTIEITKLKEVLFEIAKTSMQTFISKYKPK